MLKKSLSQHSKKKGQFWSKSKEGLKPDASFESSCTCSYIVFAIFNLGSLIGSPTWAAAQLAALKQSSPKTPELAALLGHARGEYDT